MPPPCSPDCAEFETTCRGASCPYRPDRPGDLTTRILADPGWTRLVVCAAVASLEASDPSALLHSILSTSPTKEI